MSNNGFFAGKAMAAQRNQRAPDENTQPNKGPLLSPIVMKEQFAEHGYKDPCTLLQHKNFLPATGHAFAQDADGTLFCTRCLINATELMHCKGDLRVAKMRLDYWMKEVAALEAKANGDANADKVKNNAVLVPWPTEQ